MYSIRLQQIVSAPRLLLPHVKRYSRDFSTLDLSRVMPIFLRSVSLTLEVMDMIVRELQYDLHSLKACSLASRNLCELTRKYLFRRLNLYVHLTEGRTRGSELLELFTTSRHILPHIHEVRLLSLFPTDTASRYTDSQALRVLINIKSLRKISLCAYNNKSWTAIPTAVQLAIKTAFRFPTITHISAVAMSDFPVYLLEGCSALKELSLAVTPTCHPITEKDGVAQKSMKFLVQEKDPISLEKLELTLSTPSLVDLGDWLLGSKCRLDVSSLRFLEIRARGRYQFYERQRILWKLLSACCATLEELRFDAYAPNHEIETTAPANEEAESPTVTEMYDLIDLGQVKTLRRLSITFGIPNVYDDKRHITLLARMLRNIDVQNALEEISIFLWITSNHIHTISDSSRILASGSWEILDATLSSTEAFQHLKHVKIQLSNIIHRRDGDLLVEICLPRLIQRGIVQVQDKLPWIS